MYGKYHLTTASSFYSAAGAWTLSPSPGSGSPSQALANTTTTNAQGQTVYTNQIVRMSPIYQVLQVPGQTTQTYNLLDAFVPVSTQNQIQTLSGFMIAGSDPGHYGQLQVFVTPQGQPVDGPSIVAARIDATQSISKEISLLNQEGSTVLLGNVLMIPVAQSLLYVQPLYVQSSRNNFPELQEVIAVYGKEAAYGDTLASALSQVFAAPVSTTPTSGASGTLSPQVLSLLAQAQASYAQAQTDLHAGNLGAYQNDIAALEADLQLIQQLTGTVAVPGAGGATPTTTPTTTTPTTVPSTTTTTTTTKPGTKSTTTTTPTTKATTATTAPA
jgi:hypothetical protein